MLMILTRLTVVSLFCCLATTSAMSQILIDRETPVIELINQLSVKDQAARGAAQNALVLRRNETVGPLVNALDSNDETLRLAVADTLLRQSSNNDFSISDKDLKTLLAFVKTAKQDQVKNCLLNMLGHMGPRSEDIRETLIFELTSDVSPIVRSGAARGLCEYAKLARPALQKKAVEALAKSVKSDSVPMVRSIALVALGSSTASPSAAMPGIIEALDDNFVDVRKSAVHACRSYGIDARPALPKIIEMLSTESDHGLRVACIEAIPLIDNNGQDSLKALLPLLQDQRYYSIAADALLHYGSHASVAIPTLVRMLDSGDQYVRAAGARALGSIGPEAKSALPALNRLLGSDPLEKTYVQDAIKKIQAAN